MEDEELGLSPVKSSKELETNRNLNQFANTVNESPVESATEIPVNESSPVIRSLEREEYVANDSSSEILSRLESLPPKLLNRIICGVDFEDLRNLILVSKRISEASILAKEWFNSPKQSRPVRNRVVENVELRDEEDEVEAPNAPNGKRLAESRNEEVLTSIYRKLF